MALPENPGLTVSGAMHLCWLALAVLSFSQSSPLEESQETIPVAVLSNEQFSQIMKGEKSAVEAKPSQRAEKIAQLPDQNFQHSPVDAPQKVPAPPPPPSHAVKEIEDEQNPVQRPAKQRPAEVAKSEPKPVAAKPAVPPPKPEPEDSEEAIGPKAAPQKPILKFRPDELAKLLEEDKKEKQKPGAKPKSSEQTEAPDHKFDAGDIAKFLSKEPPQKKQQSGHELTQVASLGAPTASAAKMSPSLWDQLDGLLQEQYKHCWSFGSLGGQQKYVPEIHVHYSPDGALIGEPVLLNPPSDPNLRGLAESAMRAVHRCDPLRIPSQYQPFYEQWKGRIVRFDPEEML